MSETFKRNYVWYRLDGKSAQAMRRILEIEHSGQQATKEELKKLADALGYSFAVGQRGPDYAYAVFPAIFAHPFNKEEFYLKAPIGHRKDEGETHFKPEDGVPLTEKEADHLEMGLFPPQGASIPIIERYPVPLAPRPQGPQP